MGVEVFQDLVASVPGISLLPIDARFWQAPDIDIMGKHALADMLEVHEVVLRGDLVRVVQEEAHVAGRFGTKRVAIIVVRKESLGRRALGRNEQTCLAKATRDMMNGGRVGDKGVGSLGCHAHA